MTDAPAVAAARQALDGVTQAHTATIPALVNDMLWRHAAGVVNDALEVAAALVERQAASGTLALAEVPEMLRSLKRNTART